jgi:hypothetical protein
MCSKIIIARESKENIARQQSPITQEMYSTVLDLANKSPVDSLESVVADWFTLTGITGLHCAEYAQRTQSSINEHEYPSGKGIVKAFIPTDWKFYNSKGSLICNHTLNGNLQKFQVKLKITILYPEKQTHWSVNHISCQQCSSQNLPSSCSI